MSSIVKGSAYLFFAFLRFIEYHYGVEEEGFLTRDQVMKYLHISRTSLYMLMKRGAFPYYRLERKILFRKSDIDAFMEAHKVASSPKKSRK
jgi:excisionase family DNA binding protein